MPEKVLVTGGAGFIGSNIVDALLKGGMVPIVVDDLSTGDRNNVNDSAVFHECDIRDAEKLENIFAGHKPDYVIHTAAQISVSKSVREPLYDADVNIVGILNLLELSTKYGVEKFVFSSSGGVMYGEKPVIFPSPETICPDPMSPYGIAKLTSERYLKFYASERNLNYTALRYGNVYGPRQNPYGEAGVIAIFAEKMLGGEPVTINGDGEFIRDYVYVEDVVEANMKALGGGDGMIMNVGTGVGKSVNDIFRTLKLYIDYDKEPIYGPERPGDLRKSILDSSLLRKTLDWNPISSFEEGIEKTVKFFKEGKI